MIAPNSLKIIINKGKKKEKFIFFLSIDQVFKITIIFLATFYISKKLIGEFYALMIGFGAMAFYAVLCFELPDHLSMLEHIKLFFNFLTNQPKNYLYYKEINVEKEEEEIEYEFIQEERIQPIEKEKRKKIKISNKTRNLLLEIQKKYHILKMLFLLNGVKNTNALLITMITSS